MEEKLLALLKAKFTGEREDGLNLLANAIALQVNTEEEGTKAVEGLTEDKVKSYISNWRKKGRYGKKQHTFLIPPLKI